MHADKGDGHELCRRSWCRGCFGLLHSARVAFLAAAATYGDLYAVIGSDENVKRLKGRYAVSLQDERKYIVSALRCVREASSAG